MQDRREAAMLFLAPRVGVVIVEIALLQVVANPGEVVSERILRASGRAAEDDDKVPEEDRAKRADQQPLRPGRRWVPSRA